MTSGQLKVKLRDYSELIAWQRAMDFVEAVYRVTRTFPRDEVFGLTSQLRRAVVSIPSNIAEGQSRRSRKEFLQFRSIAQGSLSEAETQLLIAERLGYTSKRDSEDLLGIAAELGRVMNGPSNAIRRRS